MALSATVYVFAIEFADSHRSVYTSLELRLALRVSRTFACPSSGSTDSMNRWAAATLAAPGGATVADSPGGAT